MSLHSHARGETVNSHQRFKRVLTEPIKWPHVETRTYTQTLPARSNWPRKLMRTTADEAGVISARGVSGPSSTSQVSRHNRQSGSRSQNSLRMNLDDAFLCFPQAT